MPPGWAASRFNAFSSLTQPVQFDRATPSRITLRTMPTTSRTGASRRRTTAKSTAVSAAGLTVMFLAVAVMFLHLSVWSFIYDGAILVLSFGGVKTKIVLSGAGFWVVFVVQQQIQHTSCELPSLLPDKDARNLLVRTNCAIFQYLQAFWPYSSVSGWLSTTLPWLSNSMSMMVPSPLGR